jgi:hypothetical protein
MSNTLWPAPVQSVLGCKIPHELDALKWKAIGRRRYSCNVSIFRTNIPKEIMPFPDYPFHETEASFVHHTDVLKYLKEYAQHYGLYEHIRVRFFSLYISLLRLFIRKPSSLNHIGLD